MKKKKSNKVLIIILVVILLILLSIFIYKKVSKKATIEKPKVINTIKGYNYTLKSNKNANYQKKFKELAKILNAKEIDEEAYAKKLAEMFIIDFYSLKDKKAKTDVGGTNIVHKDILANFLENAENTYYKYIESNIYGNREQNLPEVGTVTINEIKTTEYSYNDKSDKNAYILKVSWDYTEQTFNDYQKEATLIFVHQNKKLYLVELR